MPRSGVVLPGSRVRLVAELGLGWELGLGPEVWFEPEVFLAEAFLGFEFLLEPKGGLRFSLQAKILTAFEQWSSHDRVRRSSPNEPSKITGGHPKWPWQEARMQYPRVPAQPGASRLLCIPCASICPRAFSRASANPSLSGRRERNFFHICARTRRGRLRSRCRGHAK
jgi:hypothetical protein